MATPSYKELLTGHTDWRRSHKGVTYLVSFHGHRTGDEYAGADPHPGTWCWYLMIPEQMFPHRWGDFACVERKFDWGVSEQNTAAFDDLPFHGGITWASNEPYTERKTGKRWGRAKIGCDYNHLWDREGDYYHTFKAVCEDAERCVDAFLERHPDHHIQSDWSGRWDAPERFYTAINGRVVHVEDELPADYDKWGRPAEASPAALPA